MHECLDVKAQSRAHARNIFIIEFFQYGGLSGVVKTAAPNSLGFEGFLLNNDDLQK